MLNYKKDEDLSEADLVGNRLGDVNGKKARVIKGEVGPQFVGEISLDNINRAVSA